MNRLTPNQPTDTTDALLISEGDTTLLQLENQTTLLDTLGRNIEVVARASVDSLEAAGSGTDPVSIIAIAVSLLSLFLTSYWEYFRTGELKAASISAVGLSLYIAPRSIKKYQVGPPIAIHDRIISASSSSSEIESKIDDWKRRAIEIQGINVVIPLLLYSTRNATKEVIDCRLRVYFGDEEEIIPAEKFMKGMGVGNDGSHTFPSARHWKHQYVVGSEESELKHVSFFRKFSSTKSPGDDTIRFDLEVQYLYRKSWWPRSEMTTSDYEKLNTFEVPWDQILENNLWGSYTVYPTTKVESYLDYQNEDVPWY